MDTLSKHDITAAGKRMITAIQLQDILAQVEFVPNLVAGIIPDRRPAARPTA